MKRVDLAVSIVLFLVGVWVLWQATLLPQFTVFGPGPEFMPNVVGGLLMLLATIQFVNSWRSSTVASEVSAPDRDGVFRVLVILFAVFLYVGLLETVGYLIMTFAYAAVMLISLGRYRWHLNLVLAAVITFSFYWAFVVALGVPAPKGLFGI